VVVVVVVCVIALVADRVALALVQSAVAGRVQQELRLADRPAVTAHGFPFLTQVVAGRYRDVEVRAAGVSVPQLAGSTVDARLRGLHAPLSQLVSGNLSELPVDRVDGVVALPYSEIVRLAGVGGLSLSQDGEWVRVQGRVTALGQTFTASARARVAIHAGALVVTADQGSLLGVRLPATLLALLTRALSFALPVPRLPLGLRLTGVRPAASAVEVSAGADHVVLRPDQLPAR
jgi:LmeA-like phospholipid-binding